MLSLSAVSEEDEVARFLDRLEDAARELVLEPEFDGLSVELGYADGHFVRGATRGDGTTGEEVAATLRTIGAVPLELRGDATPARVAVRGEVVLAKADVQKLNRGRVERGAEPFANPRNAAAGTLRPTATCSRAWRRRGASEPGGLRLIDEAGFERRLAGAAPRAAAGSGGL